jgi:hypothetical protein
MAGFTTTHYSNLEAEISYGMIAERAEPQPFEIGEVALYAVESGEIATENRFDQFLRKTHAHLGAIGLLGTIGEGIDYFADFRETESADNEQDGSNESRVRRILSAIAGCAVNTKEAPAKAEEEQEHEERHSYNEQLDSIREEGVSLYFELRQGTPAQVIDQEIGSYFGKRNSVELSVYQNQAINRSSRLAKNDAHQERIDEWLKGSLHRARQMQVVAYQMKKFITTLQQ